MLKQLPVLVKVTTTLLLHGTLYHTPIQRNFSLTLKMVTVMY